jgi:hypothetical protein
MSDFSRWRPALLLVGGATLVVLVLLRVLRSDPVPAPAPTPSAPIAAASVTAAPAAPSSSDHYPTQYDGEAGVYVVVLPDGQKMPLPPGITSAEFAPENPAQKPITNEWKLEKTHRIFAVVSDRAARLEADIAALDKAGKAADAAEKRVLLKRLNVQLESMKTEMAAYQKDILADGGVVDGALFFDAGTTP